MCGIVGLWCFGTSDVAPQRFRSVVRSLAHRGPDGEGAFHDVEARLHLGHRRLAILDPTPAGAQPMSTDDGDLVIVHNGEIYDFVELREELEGLGHRFRTDTDTEVLLAAYREWGEGMLGRLNGMWAFAIWDRAHRRLFAARDRFGVKPFLYHRGAGLFAFASELKAFAALPGFTPALDAATLVLNPMEMETVGPTLLEGVRSLPPGHLLVVDADGRIQERRWWSTADNLPDVPRTYGEQVEAFAELFADACRIRLRADVPLGTSLSGGLDSSSVVAMVHAVGGQQGFTADWQRVFSQGHLGSDQDESVWAAKVADRIGVPITWTDISVEEELDRLEDSVLAFEGVHFLPLGVWSHYRSLREHGVLISIDGHGGDELLGGYARFPKAMRQRFGEEELAEISRQRAVFVFPNLLITSLGINVFNPLSPSLTEVHMHYLRPVGLGPEEDARRNRAWQDGSGPFGDSRRSGAPGDANGEEHRKFVEAAATGTGSDEWLEVPSVTISDGSGPNPLYREWLRLMSAEAE
jgi:asparagine synthase (glutamine-hydrolysing)